MISVDIEDYGLATAWFQPVLMQRPHRHNEVELNFVEQGSMTYLFGGTRARVDAGQMVLFWASIPHQVIIADEPSVLHWVTIPFLTFLQWRLPDMLTRLVIGGKFVMEMGDENRQESQQLFRRWYEDLQKGTDEYRKIVLLEVEARLRRLALAMQPEGVSAGISTPELPAGEPGKVERMACFIAENYTEPLRIEQVAQEVHLHPNYAVSLFHKHCGLSIVDYLTQYRVAHAQRLLVTTNATVSSIALESGFGSVSRFYTAFKDVCGQAPAAYRKSVHYVLSE